MKGEESPGSVSRRSLLTAGLAAGAGLFLQATAEGRGGRILRKRKSAAMYATEAFAPKAEELKAANDVADHLAALKDASIARINKAICPNANHLLVHLPMHHHPLTGKPNVKWIEYSQTLWKEMLLKLMTHLHTKDIHSEGKFADPKYRLFVEPPDMKSILAEHAIEPAQNLAPLNPMIASGSNRHLLIQKGADFVLRMEKKANLHGIEWPDIKELANLAEKNCWPDLHKYLHDMRNTAALEIIAAERLAFALVFYGAGHDWRKMILQWNLEHPDHLFSLLEIFLDSEKEYSERPNNLIAPSEARWQYDHAQPNFQCVA